MTSPTRRQLSRRLEDLQSEADEREEWSDVEAWRAFITGKNPHTGEPISAERRAEYRRALARFAARPATATETATDDADTSRGHH